MIHSIQQVGSVGMLADVKPKGDRNETNEKQKDGNVGCRHVGSSIDRCVSPG
jgi:hypothetical protein